MLRQICVFSVFISLIFFGPFLYGQSHATHTTLNAINTSIDSLLSEMSLDQKIGQLFFINVLSSGTESYNKNNIGLIQKYQPGGVLFMQGGPNRQMDLMKRFNKVSNTPLFYSIDGEWGVSMRIDSVLWFPKHMMLGAIRDNRVVEEIGLAIGQQCRRLGIHINFAPVLDVNNNASNPVINMRSFGENPYRVADKGFAYFTGLQEAGVMAVGKHFPGHGDTNLDSHVDLPVIDKSLDALLSNELIPFKRSAGLGIDGMMAGHLIVPALDRGGLPVSLSQQALSYLKNQLAFDGLIFSDALNMRAVDDRFENHYLKAFMAGNDVLLFPSDLSEAIKEIKQGLADSIILEQQIDQRVKKILKFKVKYIGDDPPEKYNKSDDHVSYRNVLDKSIKHAITLVKNDNRLIPLTADLKQKVMLITIGAKFDSFAHTLRKYRAFDVCNIDLNDEKTMNNTLLKAPDYDLLVVAFAGNIFSVSTNYGFNNKVQDFLLKLPAQKSISLNLFTNPYALAGIKESLQKRLASILVAYEYEPEIENVTAQIIMGGAPAMGMLPVSAGKMFPAGIGLFTSKVRLGYAFPENNHLLNDTLRFIDSIVYKAIEDKATPGCQVIIAKDGDIVFDKSYGFKTYDKKDTVGWQDIYDLASVTKITSTLPVIMNYDEEGKINLDMKLKTFEGLCRDTFKNDVTIRELLLHQSGLKPYIPFQYMLFDVEKLKDGLFSRKKSSVFRNQVSEGIYINRRAKFKEGFVTQKMDSLHSIEVLPGMYMFDAIRDSIYTWIDTSDVDSTRSYRYSDLNFYYLEKIIDEVSDTSLDALADSMYYDPLGMNNTFFIPAQKVDLRRIVPTEDDKFFRKKLLQGYVHDQSAAMVGGVSGHAGLFSNATDLAKFGQMLLNDGWYGDKRYFSTATLEYYTQTGNQVNRRGLGFDKPEPDTSKVSPACVSASLKSFGHSGFTGTYLWVDPEHHIVYVFLSNRVHPDAYNRKLIDNNVRTDVQQKIYNGMVK